MTEFNSGAVEDLLSQTEAAFEEAHGGEHNGHADQFAMGLALCRQALAGVDHHINNVVNQPVRLGGRISNERWDMTHGEDA